MALINCPECNNQVSSEAKTCPMCGFTLKVPTGPTTLGIVGFIMSLIPLYGLDWIGGILCFIDLKHEDGRDKKLSKWGYYIVLGKILIPLTLCLICIGLWLLCVILAGLGIAFG